MFGKRKQEKRERKKGKKSLSRSMQRLVLAVAVVILLTASGLNIIAARIEFAGMFSIISEQVLNSMKAIVGMMGGFDQYAGEVIRTWEGIPEEIRKNPDSPEYRAYFDQYENGEYAKQLSHALEQLHAGLMIGDMFFVAVDQESGRMICLMDPDGEFSYEHFRTGSWRELTDEQAESLISGDSDYELYTRHTEQAGRLLEFGARIQEDKPPYVFLAMYDFPEMLSTVTAAFFAVAYVIILSILILVIVLITRKLINRRLVRPINSVMSATEMYVQKKKEGAAETNCFSELDIHTRDELEELGDVMAHMERDIGTYERDLADVVATQSAIKTELSVATGIQAHMLPDAKTVFPDRSDFSIYASMNPAREVGGDFYDFFLIDENHLGITIADVSGKGIPAALFMMSSMIIINNFATLGFSPGVVLEKANTKICHSNVLDMFVTVWFGILDLRTGEVTAANAGHEYPVIGGEKKMYKLIRDRHGLVIGAAEGMEYTEYTFRMQKEDTLFLYTDGVAEATDEEERLYGTDRLLRVLNREKEKSVEEICSAVKEDIDQFVKDAPQFDDITMLCIRYHGR